MQAGDALPRFLAVMAVLASPMVQAADVPSFEAASINPASIPVGGEGRNRSRIEYSPKSLTMLNVDLTRSVEWAYGVEYFQISAPHISSETYDILAKTADAVSVSQLRLMLQDLLARRFHLTLHRETRMVSVYELVAAKGGPKLPPPKPDASVHAAESLPRIENDSFVFHDSTMPHFAAVLMQLRGIDLPVVDRTGIAGTFDLALKGAPAVTREGDTAALFAIVQDQLGLRLAPAKDPMEVIVIDHADKPTGN